MQMKALKVKHMQAIPNGYHITRSDFTPALIAPRLR